jgi:guanylate kinase
MSGKLIFVSGLTGAGKTTLIGESLKRIDNIEVLLTHTTRPIRVGEESSYQYIFVDEEGYELAKNKSNNWDETIYSEFRYGSDAEKFINDLDSGINVIVSVTPNIDDIQLMESIYKVEPISIWINTSDEIAHSRVEGDIRRSSRVENDAIKNQFNIIYEPSGILDDDVKSFTELIYNIIS